MQLDFEQDVKAICAARLAAAGYASQGNLEADFRAYLNVLNRRVPVMKRHVYKAKSYVVPAALVSGEQQFIQAVLDGSDLRPYQSTRLSNPNFEDGMLNDFGVQHFHVGIGPHPSISGLKARTDPVLFALVKGTNFYCIGFFGHPPHNPNAWSQQQLLNIIHDNWPAAMQEYAVKGALDLSRSFSDAELGTLRKNGINTMTKRPDGTIHMSPGGGVTSAKGGAKAVKSELHLLRICDGLEKQVLERFQVSDPNSDQLPDALHLRESGGAMVVESTDGSVSIPVSDFHIPAI